VALVVVVPDSGGPDPRPADAEARRTDPAQRVISALSSSVRAMRGPVPRREDVTVLAFADLFARSADEEPGQPDGLAVDAAVAEKERAEAEPLIGWTEELADELLRAWWLSATRIGQCEIPAERRRQEAEPADPAGELGSSVYFRGSAELAAAEARALSRYLTDLKLRHEARDRTQSAIQPDTRVVVGHGLGALIAYEALCVLGDAASVTFISLGAAMCGPDQVFERLEPAPRNEQGYWPASVRRWFNVVAHSDPTAMIAPQLTARFGPGIEDEVIEIRSSCGELSPYLSDRATGRALATGLS